MHDPERAALIAALEWHIAEGAGEMLEAEPQNAAAMPGNRVVERLDDQKKPENRNDDNALPAPIARSSGHPAMPLGSLEIRNEAKKLALSAHTLDELREAIRAFDGIALKKTATNLVFADGNSLSPVMLIGEAPGADEDRVGKPFVGVSGQLLDRIVACIGLDRADVDPAKSLYIANILNWRPPGNRTPSPGEIEASLPFIERHIALARPKVLILCGGVSAQALLGRTEGISKLRNRWHDYTPRTEGIAGDSPAPIPAIATYHPSYLLRTPSQKRAVWQDMLTLQERMKALG